MSLWLGVGWGGVDVFSGSPSLSLWVLMWSLRTRSLERRCSCSLLAKREADKHAHLETLGSLRSLESTDTWGDPWSFTSRVLIQTTRESDREKGRKREITKKERDIEAALFYLSSSSLRALSMFMRWPTRVTPRSIRSSFCRLGRWLPSISLSMKASLCSARWRLSSQSATSCLVHMRRGLPAKGLLEAAWSSVSGEGERLPAEHKL